MDLSKYDGMSYSELKAVFEGKYGPLNHDDDSQTLFCPVAEVIMIDGKLIAYNEITNVRVSHNKNYISNVYGDHECSESVTASIDGYYNEDKNSSTVYDYDDIEESSSISVDYNREGIKKTARTVVRGDRNYWLEDLVDYIVEKAGIDRKVDLESQLRPNGNVVTRKRKERKERRARQKWLEEKGYIKDNRSTLQKIKDAILIPFLFIVIAVLVLFLVLLNVFILIPINIFRMKSFKAAIAEAKKSIKSVIKDLWI